MIHVAGLVVMVISVCRWSLPVDSRLVGLGCMCSLPTDSGCVYHDCCQLTKGLCGPCQLIAGPVGDVRWSFAS